MKRLSLAPESAEAAGAECLVPRFCRIPPTRLLLFAFILSSLSLLATLFVATRVLWLGIQLEPGHQGIRVVTVLPQGPSDGILAPGDVMVSLRAQNGELLPLTGESLLREPQLFPTFAQANRFTARQTKLFGAIAGGAATFVLADGRTVRVGAWGKRPVSDLPPRFWAMAGASIFVLMVGVGIWAYSRGQASTRLVALSSVAYLMAGLCLAVYGTREWLLEPELFAALTAANSLGNTIATFSFVALLWYYPKPLGRSPVASLVVPVVTLIWINSQFLEIFELPLHAYRMPCLISVALAAWLAHRQWKATRNHPRERAVLLWFLFGFFVGVAILVANYMLPYFHRTGPKFAFWTCQVRILLLYVGLILGVLRFRLFDLDRWWFTMWAWFFGGLIVIGFDAMLIFYANFHPVGALALSLPVVGWFYFPARQWVWERFMRSPSERFETVFPLLLETFLSASSNKPMPERWQALLSQIFDPLDERTSPEPLTEPRLIDDGLVLAVPFIEGEGRILLSRRSRGSRLFSRDDLRLTSFILTLARKSVALREAQERGAAVERERIARDLHDDVAPKLLTLAHRATTPTSAEEARAALQTLRESIYALSDPRELPLEAVLAEWRVEVADRAEAADVKLYWRQPEELPQTLVPLRQRLNLGRVLRESVTNALRHAAPKSMEISIDMVGERLNVRMIHDGNIARPETWRNGKGIGNMNTRIAELGGSIEWEIILQPTLSLAISWQAPLAHHGSTPVLA